MSITSNTIFQGKYKISLKKFNSNCLKRFIGDDCNKCILLIHISQDIDH